MSSKINMNSERIIKSKTDVFWDSRSSNEQDPQKVNIADLVQRDLECDFILKNLSSPNSLLEVGCGNGYLTSLLRGKVTSMDSFDFSENMIAQAKQIYGEKNNHFFNDNILKPQHVSKQYEVVLCVRVLINLKNLDEQKLALNNLISFVKPGGKLILIEGFMDGFEALNSLRTDAKMEKLQPAPINYYSKLQDLVNLFPGDFFIQDTFHTGMFDFLTRVVYPALVGVENAKGADEFHDKIAHIAKVYNPDHMKSLARLHGWSLVKR